MDRKSLLGSAELSRSSLAAPKSVVFDPFDFASISQGTAVASAFVEMGDQLLGSPGMLYKSYHRSLRIHA